MRVPCLLALLLFVPVLGLAQGSGALQLIIQQNGQAQVTEQRSLRLEKGRGTFALDGCPATLDPNTFQVKPLAGSGVLKILGVRHEPPLSGPASLLKASVGKTVTVIIPDGLSREGRVRKEAVLVSAEEAPVFLVDGKLYAGPVDAVLYPAQPLSPSPRITLSYDNSGSERQRVEASYTASEISWRMDYSLSAGKEFTSGSLDGTVTLSNRSGVDFPAARIELLAGEPRSLAGGANKLFRAMAPMAIQEDMSAASPEPLFEYHLYKLPGALALPNQSLVQFPLLPARTIQVTRRLVARAGAVPQGHMSEPIQETAQALVTFRNTSSNGLGQPLPKGTIRIYQEDSGTRRLVGEAQLDRVAVGGKAEVVVGQAFDITIERVAREYERTGKNSFKGSWEITVRNSSPEKRQLVLQESFPGKWRVTESSHKLTRSTARAAEFEIQVPPTGDGPPMALTYSFTLEQ